MSRTPNWVQFVVIAVVIAVFGANSGYAQRGGGTGKLTISTQMSGKVVLEDSTPPPETAVVESICGGIMRPIARTDSKGGYVVGAASDLNMNDARVASTRGGSSGSGAPVRVDRGCSVRARLAGFESSTVTVIDDTINTLPNIILRRLAGVEGTTTSVTTAKAPKEAQKAYEKAKKALEKKKSDEARPLLEAATTSYPQYAIAWFDLGWIYQEAGDLAKAQNAYEQAMAADPKYIKPFIQVGTILYKQAKWKELAAITAQAIKLNPVEFPSAYVYNAFSNLQLGDAKTAEAGARQAVKIDTNHMDPMAEFLLGVSLGDQGNMKEAADHLRSYLLLAPDAPNAEAIKKQLAAWEQTTAAGGTAAVGAPPATPK